MLLLLSGSSNGLELVRSICRQLHYLNGHKLSESDNILSADYFECVAHLHGLLASA